MYFYFKTDCITCWKTTYIRISSSIGWVCFCKCAAEDRKNGKNMRELVLRDVVLYWAHMPWRFSYLALPSHLYTTSHSKNNSAWTSAGSWTSSALTGALFFKDYTSGHWNIGKISRVNQWQQHLLSYLFSYTGNCTFKPSKCRLIPPLRVHKWYIFTVWWDRLTAQHFFLGWQWGVTSLFTSPKTYTERWIGWRTLCNSGAVNEFPLC